MNPMDELRQENKRQAAEIARLRSVCRLAADAVRKRRSFMVPGQSGYTDLTNLIADLDDNGKEPTE